MNNSKLVKMLGLIATVGGVAATLLTDWVNEKKMDEKINECIDAKLAALNDDEEDEDEEES